MQRQSLRQKKARIARIRAYRNYYCHAVLMALNQTGASAEWFPDVQFACSALARCDDVRGYSAWRHTRVDPIGFDARARGSRLALALVFARCAQAARVHCSRCRRANRLAARRREFAVARFALLPASTPAVRSGAPVPPCGPLLCERRCGHSMKRTMPHRSSDIGFMLSSLQAGDSGPVCILIRYAAARKHAVSNSK